jgi:sugar/nucleoside kinase (ribokinase family)
MTGTEILVVGDANPDLLLTGDVVPRFGQAEQLLETADLVLGGSAAIVAAGLARLNVHTALVSVVGNDQFGAFTRERLRERGVDISAIALEENLPTGLSVVLSEPRDRAILTLPGTIPSLGADAIRKAVARLEPRHVHVASYFLQPSLADELQEIFAWLRQQGISTSLDTNWDPSERWEGVEQLLQTTSVFLPNREEALAIASTIVRTHVGDLDQAGLMLSRIGCRTVIKAGVDGAVCYSAGRRMAQSSGLVLDVVDTTGAGDSFDAGYLAAMVRGIEPEQQRLHWATAAGSLSVRGRGGTDAQATTSELADAIGRISGNK